MNKDLTDFLNLSGDNLKSGLVLLEKALKVLSEEDISDLSDEDFNLLTSYILLIAGATCALSAAGPKLLKVVPGIQETIEVLLKPPSFNQEDLN
jgi:hypothetical protein